MSGMMWLGMLLTAEDAGRRFQESEDGMCMDTSSLELSKDSAPWW